MALTPSYITGFDKGLMNNKKPFLLPDQAFSTLENAYVWRERVKKRGGPKFLGRLSRTFSNIASGNSGTSPWTFNIYTVTSTTPEANAEIEPDSVVIVMGGVTFTDNGDGTISSATPGNSGIINYITGSITLITTVAAGTPVVITFGYFPGLPVMGIWQRQIGGPTIDNEPTVWFDTKYAYTWTGTGFTELVPGFTWNGSDSDFFWCYNYRGAAPQDKLFFATNFKSDAGSPMRYYDGTTWTTFAPLVTATQTLFQARILIAYYGRFLALNVYEGTTAGGYAGAVNIANRCRFSAYAQSPIATTSWQTDIFGQGGVLDAPTNEEIISATFIKNTLVVTFEKSTWQLRYVGEYGLPFIWERISSDLGGDSTFSSVLFDNHMLTVSDKAIVTANGYQVERIDLDIPDQIFDFQNQNNGVKRVWGVRDYQKELVFWNYADSNTMADAINGAPLTYPNKVLLYNYRNATWAIFRDSVTAFGTWQATSNITWDSTTVTWDDDDYTWDDIDTQSMFPYIVSGNQQGFINLYNDTTSLTADNQATLTVHGINLTTTPIQITSFNHNLQPNEIIYLQSLNFQVAGTPVTSSLNNSFFQVQIVDINTISLYQWDFTQREYVNNFSFTPVTSATYVGGGLISLIPVLDVETKDVNIFQSKGLQTKLSFLDFLMQPTNGAAFTVNILVNSSQSNPVAVAVTNNLGTSNLEVSTNLDVPFYYPGSDMAPFRFYASLSAYFWRIQMTYDDALMNTLSTHTNDWVMYAIKSYTRPGGRVPF